MVRDAGLAHRQGAAGDAAPVRVLHPDLRTEEGGLTLKTCENVLCSVVCFDNKCAAARCRLF